MKNMKNMPDATPEQGKNLAVCLLNDYVRFYNMRDMEKILTLFSAQPHIWGTGLDEDLHTKEEMARQLERDWRQSEKNELVQMSPPTIGQGKSMWCSAIFECHTQIQRAQRVYKNGRITLVASEEEGGKWKIAHMHCSFPAHDQREGHSFPGVQHYKPTKIVPM